MHPWLKDRTVQVLLVVCVAVLLVHGVGAALLVAGIGWCALGCLRSGAPDASSEEPWRCGAWCGTGAAPEHEPSEKA